MNVHYRFLIRQIKHAMIKEGIWDVFQRIAGFNITLPDAIIGYLGIRERHKKRRKCVVGLSQYVEIYRL